MSTGSRALTIEPLVASDVVSVAQCIVIDADAFPYASARFGMRSDSPGIWVARERGAHRVLGFVAARARQGVLHMDGLAVDRGDRRSGIGRALVRGAVEHARSSGLRAVTLHVSVANRVAIALYLAEGFAIDRPLLGFYPPTAFDGETDAYEMALPLQAA